MMRNMFNRVGLKNEEERVAWLRRTLASIPAGETILDAGAGELQFKKFCSHLRYTSQDFAQYDGKGDAAGLQTREWDNSKLDIVSDITAIPVKDASFDNVMCIEVFEHLPAPIAAVNEFARILKKGGALIITAPFAALTHFAPHFYATGYSRYWYERVLGEAGFVIEEIVHNGNYFEYMGQELRRITSVDERYASGKVGRGIIYKAALGVLLSALGRMAKHNKGSEELLCFGLHVVARKK